MRWFNSLYTRLAFSLILLLFVIGVVYTAFNGLATQQYIAQLNQDLHRSLAKNLVADKNLVEQGKLNESALKQTFQQYMVVNPSIEIYLLDLNGKVLSFSADPNKVMRSHVNLAPIKAFLSGDEKYPLGDDPRSHDKQKAFSVTGVPSDAQPQGYLYVVLRGEQYDAIESMAFQGFWARAGWWSMLLSLVIGLLAGLAIFYWLTRRLRWVSRQMEAFNDSDFTHWPENVMCSKSADEIGHIEQTFAKMAARIQNQFLALKNKDNQRRHLVAQVSHDLRTPLASMLGYIESLRLKHDNIEEADRVKFLDIAYNQGKRLSAMVDSLFELSSLEAKEVQPEFEPFMPLELIFDVKQKYMLRAKNAGLKIKVGEPQSSAFVLADIALFERVVDNLITNALIHARAKSTVILSVEKYAEQVAVSVQNHGKPINTDELDALFDPYYRAGGHTADKRHAGLGLAIAKHLTESMHGSIDVANLDAGVRFTLRLPMYKPAALRA